MEDKIFLIENLQNGEELVMSDDVIDLLDAMYEFNDLKCFDDEECKNSFGKRMQSVYENIYNDNIIQEPNFIG